MSDTLEKYFNQYLASYEKEAMAQGKKQEALETVHRMVSNGFTDSDIALATNLSKEEIEEIRKSMKQ